MLTKKRVVKYLAETTKGTFNDPDSSGIIVLAVDPKYDIDLETVERDVFDGNMGKLAHLIGKKSGKLTFKAEVGGTGSAYTAASDIPAWADLLNYCGLESSFDIDTFTIIPTSDESDTLSFSLYIDGKRVNFAGCVGKVNFTMEVGQIIYAEFEFTGVYYSEEVKALPTVTGAAALEPAQLLSTTFTIGGSSYNINSLNINLDNNITLLTTPATSTGYRYGIITDRNYTGKIDPEQDTANLWLESWKAGSTAALIAYTGTDGNGDYVKFNCPQIAYSKVADSDRDALATNDIDFLIAKTFGNNNEITITIS